MKVQRVSLDGAKPSRVDVTQEQSSIVSEGVEKFQVTDIKLPPFKNDKILADVLRDESICRQFVSDITGISVTRIVKVTSQEELHTVNIKGEIPHSVLNIVVEFDCGVMDIELQLVAGDFPDTRARIYSSLLDSKYFTKSGDGKYEVGLNYLVLLTDYDAHGMGAPVQHYVMQDMYSGRELGDGRHIIYVDFNRAGSSERIGPMVKAICGHLGDKFIGTPEFDEVRRRYFEVAGYSYNPESDAYYVSLKEQILQAEREKAEEHTLAVSGEFIKLLQNGNSINVAAAKLGISMTMAKRICIAFGIPF